MKNSMKYYLGMLAAFATVGIFTSYTPKPAVYGDEAIVTPRWAGMAAENCPCPPMIRRA